MKAILTSIFASYALNLAQTQPAIQSSTQSAVQSSTQQPLTIISEPFTPTISTQPISSINTQIPYTETTSRLITGSSTTTTAPAAITSTTSTSAIQPPPPQPSTTNTNIHTSTNTPIAPITTSPPILHTIVTTAPKPSTSAPVTTTTTTQAPYINQFCPVYNNPITGYNIPYQQRCSSLTGPNSIAIDFGGDLQCDSFACCSCQTINCGYNGVPCHNAHFGDSGAVGVQDINIMGSLTPFYQPGTFGMIGQFQLGAHIECNGLESCKNSKINGNTIGDIDCGGDFGCKSAHFSITNPAPGMTIDCGGMYSCLNANIEINIGQLPANGQCAPHYRPKLIEIGNIQFNGPFAGQSAIITVNNRGCDMVMIEHIDCPNTDSCFGAEFRIFGNVQIQQCDITGLVQMPVQCLQQGYNSLFHPQQNIYPNYPQSFPPFYQMPIIPQQPQINIPQTPMTTQSAVQPIQPIATPINQQQQQPPYTQIHQMQPMLIPMMGSNVELQCHDLSSCARKAIRVVNPETTWQLECALPGACNGMQLSLDFVSGYFTDRIEGFIFTAQNSAQNAVIKVNAPYFMEINTIRCEESGACNGLTIEVGPGVDIYNMNMECQHQGSCFGCNIKQNHMNIPCEAIANHNVGLFMNNQWNPVGPIYNQQTQTQPQNMQSTPIQQQWQQPGVNQYNQYTPYTQQYTPYTQQYNNYPQTFGYP